MLDVRDCHGLTRDDLSRIVEAKREPIDLVQLMESKGIEAGPGARKLADLVRSCTEFNLHFRPGIGTVIGGLERIARA